MRRLKALEDENSRLKKIVADLTLDRRRRCRPDAAEADGVQALRYAELLSEKLRDALLCEAAANDEARAVAVALRPDLAAELVWRAALALDLEADGRTTRQIGMATAAGSCLLLDGGGPEELAEAFATLSRRLSEAPIVVGHNALAWDLPVLRQEGIDPLATGSVWDTLLVEVLLDPRAVSHALSGAHRADMDAATRSRSSTGSSTAFATPSRPRS